MSISKIMSNEPVINNAQAAPMQKAEPAPEAATSPVIAGKEAFDNPAETAGRSQVNFRGGKFLSVKDLNKLARSNMLDKMSGEEISTAKKALVDVMGKYKCSDLSSLSKNFQNGKIDPVDLTSDFANAILKHDPKADVDKIDTFLTSIL